MCGKIEYLHSCTLIVWLLTTLEFIECVTAICSVQEVKALHYFKVKSHYILCKFLCEDTLPCE